MTDGADIKAEEASRTTITASFLTTGPTDSVVAIDEGVAAALSTIATLNAMTANLNETIADSKEEMTAALIAGTTGASVGAQTDATLVVVMAVAVAVAVAVEAIISVIVTEDPPHHKIPKNLRNRQLKR